MWQDNTCVFPLSGVKVELLKDGCPCSRVWFFTDYLHLITAWLFFTIYVLNRDSRDVTGTGLASASGPKKGKLVLDPNCSYSSSLSWEFHPGQSNLHLEKGLCCPGEAGEEAFSVLLPNCHCTHHAVSANRPEERRPADIERRQRTSELQTLGSWP